MEGDRRKRSGGYKDEKIVSLNPQSRYPVPEKIHRVAHAAFPKGNLFIHMQAEQEIYRAAVSVDWFPACVDHGDVVLSSPGG